MKKGQNTSKTNAVAEAARSFNWKRALVLLFSCAFALGLYFYLIRFDIWMTVVIAYVAIASVLIIAYFIVNRAFTGKGVTYEMLPDTMTHEEKEEYLADVASRERRSRWMLFVIFPIVVTLMVDLFKLFVLDALIG